jgi:ParB family transcriptional regulator, chromosome partitioning protein
MVDKQWEKGTAVFLKSDPSTSGFCTGNNKHDELIVMVNVEFSDGKQSLIPSTELEIAIPEYDGRILRNIKIENIVLQPQARQYFDKQLINQLALSIKEHGLFSPIEVRLLNDGLFGKENLAAPIGDKTKFYIVSGERRCRATIKLDLKRIAAFIEPKKEGWQIRSLVENIHREDLRPMEEAEAMDRLKTQGKMKQKDIAKKLNRTAGSISGTLSLNNLPWEVKKSKYINMFSKGQLIKIAALKDPTLMYQRFELLVSAMGEGDNGGTDVDKPQAVSKPKKKPPTVVTPTGMVKRITNLRKSFGTVDTSSWEDEELIKISKAISELKAELRVLEASLDEQKKS